MQIRPTLIITSSSIGEEVFNKFRTHLLLSYGKECAELMEAKCTMLALDDNLFIKNEKNEILVRVDQQLKDNWNIQEYWKSFETAEELIHATVKKSIDYIRNASNNQRLNEIRKIETESQTNILVLLPVYKPAESTFLTFLISKVFKKLGVVNFDYNIIGLLPETESQISLEDKNNYLCRTYACITECDHILDEQNDLLNSFVLLSNKNTKNNTIDGKNDLYPFIVEYINKSFFHIGKFPDNRNVNLSNNNRNKLGFYSSFGYSAFIFDSWRFLTQLKNRICIKIIESVFAFLNKEKLHRDIFYIEFDSFVKKINWDDKQKLLEGSGGYIAFTEQNKLNNVDLGRSSTEDIVKRLSELIEKHEKDSDGYFRGIYGKSLASNIDKQLKSHKIEIVRELKKILDTGILGLKKSKAFLLALVGKEDNDTFDGTVNNELVNLKTNRYAIADHYRKYLPENERIFSADLLIKEKEVKEKQSQLEKCRKEIEVLEENLYGWIDQIEDINDQTTDNKYFTINGKQVSIIGAADYNGPMPDCITPYEPGISEGGLPKIVDLRPYLTPIENQYQIGSCTANSCIGAYEYIIKRATENTKDFSRLFVYYNGREKGGYANEDKGSAICYCIESMMQKGVCLESTWPYTESYVLQKPSTVAYREAEDHTVVESQHFESNLVKMKQCLAEGFPFIFGLKLFNSFQRTGPKGIVPYPEPAEQSLNVHGSHAMLCVGYSDVERFFIVRNSWGNQWGNNGYCYIPYDYLADSNFHCSENNFLLKVIKDSENLKVNYKKGIARDDGSLFNFGSDLNRLNVLRESYEKLKAQLDELIESYKIQSRKFEEQNDFVLADDFRLNIENIELNSKNAEINNSVDEIKLIDGKIKKLKEEKENLKEKQKQFILRYAIVIPVIFILLLIIGYYITGKIWSFNNLNSLLVKNIDHLIGIGSLVLFVYGLIVLWLYKVKIYNLLKANQNDINDNFDKRRTQIGILLQRYDEYFEIKREHNLNSKFLDYRTALIPIINELINKLEVWLRSLDRFRDDFQKDSPDEEFISTFLVRHACSIMDINSLIKNLNVLKSYLKSGDFSMASFIIDKDELIVEAGIVNLIHDMEQYAEKSNDYISLSKVTIFDFLYNSKIIRDIFTEKQIHDPNETIKVINESSYPFIVVKSTSDKIDLNNSFELQYPNEATEYPGSLISMVNTSLVGILGNEKVEEVTNNNDDTSSIVFFRTISLMPAYIIETVQEAYGKYIGLSDMDKKKIHINGSYLKLSCIPDDLKDCFN